MGVHKSLIIALSISVCLSCSPDKKQVKVVKADQSPKINQQVFDGIYRASKAIDSSITVGINFMKFQELLQSLATEIAIANDKVKTQEEKELLKNYSLALTTYHDSATLWNRKIKGGWEENGERYTILDGDQEVRLIAETYNLATSDNRYGRGKMIPIDDSIKVVWTNAHEQVETANSLLQAK